MAVFKSTNPPDIQGLPEYLSREMPRIDAAINNLEYVSVGGKRLRLTDKLQESISVKDFGAVGDGITDDSPAINEAINAVSTVGGFVFFPPGTYIVSSSVTIPSYVTLAGVGSKNTALIKASGSLDYVVRNTTTSSNPPTQNIGIENIGIQGNSNTIAALYLEGCQYSHFKNLYITGVTSSSGYGVELTTYDIGGGTYVGASMNDFIGVRVQNCYNGWHFTKNVSDTGTDGANLNQLYSCNTTGYGSDSASSLTGIGTYVEYGEGNTFIGCRNLTGNDWTTAWQVQDSVNTFVGCAADGSIGGTAPDGSENSYGMPYGYDNNARGFYFTSTATGSILINPLGNSPKERVSFEDQSTFETIFVLRHQFNWFGLSRFDQIGIGNTFDASIYSGSGSPEGSVTAKVGSVYMRTDGGAGTTLYVKESGSDNTGWQAK